MEITVDKASGERTIKPKFSILYDNVPVYKHLASCL